MLGTSFFDWDNGVLTMKFIDSIIYLTTISIIILSFQFCDAKQLLRVEYLNLNH